MLFKVYDRSGRFDSYSCLCIDRSSYNGVIYAALLASNPKQFKYVSFVESDKYYADFQISCRDTHGTQIFNLVEFFSRQQKLTKPKTKKYNYDDGYNSFYTYRSTGTTASVVNINWAPYMIQGDTIVTTREIPQPAPNYAFNYVNIPVRNGE